MTAELKDRIKLKIIVEALYYAFYTLKR